MWNLDFYDSHMTLQRITIVQLRGMLDFGRWPCQVHKRGSIVLGDVLNLLLYCTTSDRSIKMIPSCCNKLLMHVYSLPKLVSIVMFWSFSEKSQWQWLLRHFPLLKIPFFTEHQCLLNQRRHSTVYHHPSLPCTLSSEVLTSAGPWMDPSICLALSRCWVIKLHLCRQDSHSFRQAAISSCVTVFVIEVDRLTDARESASSGILPLDF